MVRKKLDSEYKSHFKSIAVHRPVTVKAKVQSEPSGIAPEMLESNRRAGLLSSQLGSVSEPALQRRKIVPYKHNHNIFETKTVKELDDNQWLDAVGTDDEPVPISKTLTKTRNHDAKASTTTRKKETEYTSHYAQRPSEQESPLMAANKTKNRLEERASKTFSLQKSQEGSPERMPPAGIPTYISDPRDKRLLRPSDSSAYLTFPDKQLRKSETEYCERYENAAASRVGHTTAVQDKETSLLDEDTYRKVLQHRNDSYGLAATASRPTNKASAARNKDVKVHKQSTKKHSRSQKDRGRTSKNEGSEVSSVYSDRQPKHSEKVSRTTRQKTRQGGNGGERPDVVEAAVVVQRHGKQDDRSVSSARSIRSDGSLGRKKEQVNHSSSNYQKTKTKSREPRSRNRRRDWDEMSHASTARDTTDSARSVPVLRKTAEKKLVERGRSPTPEMRHVGQSRRHHLDVTTGSSNPLASSVDADRFRTRVLNSKMAELGVRGKSPRGRGGGPREKYLGEYDPSRYSDAGGESYRGGSIETWSGSESVGSRSVTSSARSSGRL